MKKLKLFLVATGLFGMQVAGVMAQEGAHKFVKPDSARFRADSSGTSKGQMPVAKPDAQNPSTPIPSKRKTENEDGMPVKTVPDSTMNRPQR